MLAAVPQILNFIIDRQRTEKFSFSRIAVAEVTVSLGESRRVLEHRRSKGLPSFFQYKSDLCQISLKKHRR
jgi:hypothetical protein